MVVPTPGLTQPRDKLVVVERSVARAAQDNTAAPPQPHREYTRNRPRPARLGAYPAASQVL